jgi:hypothetical protein
LAPFMWDKLDSKLVMPKYFNAFFSGYSSQ